MTAADQSSDEFEWWRAAPGRSAAGATVGLVSSWLLGGWLIIGMMELEPGTADINGTDFFFWMVTPLLVGAGLCVPRRIRFWAGAFVPGMVMGWLLGCLTFVLLWLLTLLS